MRWTQNLIPTLREEPAEAEAISHRLMLRAGLVRQLAAGIYVYLPLGQRVLDRVNAIIREEMNRIGGQEITMPVLHPAEIWQQTGRWSDVGPEMFRLKDRNQRDLCLGMTHEEVIAWIAAREIRSYRELPQIWYQIQTKERDEARPRSGGLRTREFLMKDSYTLDVDDAALDRGYELHYEAYRRIFTRCGLTFSIVESDVGMMGGRGAHEFMAPSDAGEDQVAICDGCGYAANVELAVGRPPAPAFPAWALEEVATPDCRTIEEVSRFLGVEPAVCLKTLLVVGSDGPVMACVRGDHQVHEKKLARVIGEFRPAHREEVLQATGIEAGFIGPVGAGVPVLADESLRAGAYVAGANRAGYHLRGVVPGRDFSPRFADLQETRSGDACPKCGAALRVEKVIEIGNIFKLGTKYSVAMKAFYLNERGEERPIVMGSYGIGPARIAAGAIEQHHDKDGIIWPPSIAPLDVHLTVVNMQDATMRDTAERLYGDLRAAGLAVLYDDRAERPGAKFKDADLIGLPLRVTVGARLVKDGVVELRVRQTGEETRLQPGEVVGRVQAWYAARTG